VIKALIFDFDGLIFDTETPDVEAWQAIYTDHGQVFPIRTWIEKVVGASAANFDAAAHLAGLTGRNLDQAALHARERAYRLERQAVLPARPGVEEILQSARRLGFGLAVASSSPHRWVDGYLQQLKLTACFDRVIAREDAANGKPAPDLFLAALAALGVTADEALAFEDSPNGVLAASRAGLRVVLVPNPVTAQMKIEGAQLVLASLAQLPLPELLKRMGETLDIRPETPADVDAIRAVNRSAFPGPDEAGLVDLARARGKAALSLIAVNDSHVLGHIFFSPLTLDATRQPEDAGRRGLGLGPVAVLPDRQRAGIGSRLIRAGLDAARRLGYDYVVLLGDPAYYSRFGFRPARAFGLGGDYGNGDDFQAMELRQGALAGGGRVHFIPEFAESGC
jgi:HAD superfamily hydrolase (TIGR01509 family)